MSVKTTLARSVIPVLLSGLLLALQPHQGLAQSSSARDGQHDFDFSIGTWKTHISRLQHPFSGSKNWLEYDGMIVTKGVWDGLASLQETEADGSAGHTEGLMLRLYDPETRQWHLSFASSSDGALTQPAFGEFKDGRGEFYDQEEFDGKPVIVRITFSDIKADSYRLEQAFSPDGGRSWETNWKVSFVRDKQAAADIQAPPVDAADPQQHAFDWQVGSWKIHMSRMKGPLTGSKTWAPADGTVVVRKIWGGRANLSEIESEGPAGKLQFLSLRLYNPVSHQWSLSFAGSHDGNLSLPMIGEFKDGRGEFLDQEPYNGRAILVRFVYSDTTPTSDHSEQAFSADGGRTWEVNWINDSVRN